MDSYMNTLTTQAAETIVARYPDQALARSTGTRLTAVMCAAIMLSACGGGGGGEVTDTQTAAKATAVFSPKPASPVAPVTPVDPAAPAAQTGDAKLTGAGTRLTDVRIENTGAAQTDVPFTFGQVIAKGQMNVKEGLAAKLPDGTILPLQSDIKATHADGSVRHVIISGILPSLAAGATQTLELVRSKPLEAGSDTLQSLGNSGLKSNVVITADGVQYTASLADAIADTTPENWLSGKVANEWLLDAPLKNAAGAVHPRLTARFYVRWYSTQAKQARVDVVIENTKTFSQSASSLTYDVKVTVDGRSVYSKNALTHYHHSRWHKAGWWAANREPNINIRHNTAYLMASKAVSNYDSTVVPSDATLADVGNEISASNTGPMSIGPLSSYMPGTGGRPDIGPLPSWSVFYLLSMDKRARDTMMAAADGSGSWSIHLRDEATGYPVRTDNERNARLTTHSNMADRGPLPVPRCAGAGKCDTPYENDTAHQPSLAYLPYLVTGDYYYLEELQFWTANNPLATDPYNHGMGKGLVRWQQIRGQAWSLRTLGHSAYITPDKHPLKGYFNTQLDNNLEFYNTAYVIGNPNKLGVYDGSGEAAFYAGHSTPWMDDFLTWSFGYLSELGFDKATPMFKWKSVYPVGRMTAPGYCWVEAAAYGLQYRDSPSSPLYDSFEKLYAANFGGAIPTDNGSSFTHPNGVSFMSLPCGSQAQADFLTLAHNNWTWPLGRMAGYADSVMGYPANMQPALAVAAASGIPNATQAWTTFANRASKPDYSRGPQWAIVPR